MNPTPGESRPAVLRPVVALAVLLAVTAAFNVTRTAVVPDRWHFVYNLALMTTAVGIARLTGRQPAQLGLGRSTMVDGLRLGAIAFVIISFTVIIGGLIGIVTDDSLDPSAADMLIRVLIIIPVGTVLVEEILFRAVLQDLLDSVMRPLPAAIFGAALFGLWHVYPATEGGAVSDSGATSNTALALLATFVATSVAGGGFIWLRRRSDSVIAPALAHLATNSVTYAVAWLAMGT